MRGEPYTTRHRPTLQDEPDRRVGGVHLRKLTGAQMRVLTRDTALDPRFRWIDRYLWRWSVGQGSGLPLDADDADQLPSSKPTPLSEDESIAIDLAILHSPDWARRFVFMWFRSDRTTEQIAQELQIRVRAVYEERKLVLSYYLGRFTELGISIPAWEPEGART